MCIYDTVAVVDNPAEGSKEKENMYDIQQVITYSIIIMSFNMQNVDGVILQCIHFTVL